MHMGYLHEQVSERLTGVKTIFTATSGREAEIIAREKGITAIVMDLRMRNRNGIEAARTIWSERPSTRILFWSNHSDEAYLRGISRILPEEAAYGYVLKTAPAERLGLALQIVLVEGQILVDREIHSLQPFRSQSTGTLTETEHAILLDVALGLPDKIIAERHKLSLRTVQNRLISIYEKTDMNDGLAIHEDLQINKRTRALSRAILTKIINIDEIAAAEEKLRDWLRSSGESGFSSR